MGEAASTAVLTVEDIGEKFPDSKSELRFLVPLQDSDIKIGDKHRFSVQGKPFLLDILSIVPRIPLSSVTYSPCLEICWLHHQTILGNSDRVALSREDGGFYHCDISQALPEDQVSEARRAVKRE